ncbi:RNA 2'-phosphotransferase [Kitasatospora sp. GAS204B]|uniref:RNA 2'-phosphotransferase n=1 Tax=unclassified Kitasatospora TaxID=2633591 RepID=UPI00247327A2|nr:RNA 2'-phosphotransferase [Kitasatospora sp. GAS204B]MDH6117416.1 putative RNA 2'-phosphotransferase [Kitasatospora sp. GAS204B]
MDEKRLVKTSKRLSRILRHDPGAVGLTLDEGGWVPVDTLLAAFARSGNRLSRADLDLVVANNNKQRFAYSADGSRIRASQGHTVAVDLGLAATQPPPVLYHGTAERTLPVIFAEGLRPMSRQDVHLSADVETALKVGARHGRPVVLRVDAAGLAAAGHEFRISANGVWLTDTVPPDRLTRHSAG